MKKIRAGIMIILVASMLMGMSIISSAAGSKDGITVVKEYSANFSNVMCLLVEVKNDNSVNAAVSMNAISIDANGRKMETDSTDDIIFMEPGEYYMLVSVFPNSASATNYDYDLLVNRRLNSFDFAPAGNCVDAKATLNNDGSVTVYGTNICPDTIEARAIVVYYSGGVIVDFQEGYLSNDYDLLLSPGEATEETFYTNAAYDSFEFFVTGIR